MKQTLLVLCGAVIGGVVGFFAFIWLARQGFYALVLPGGLIGVGAGIAKNRSIAVAVICGLAALLLGLYTEYRFFPFKVDETLSYFVTHLHQLKPVTWLMIAVGSAIGFWIPFRRIADSAIVLPPNRFDSDKEPHG